MTRMATTEGNGGGALRRMILLLAVAAVMAATMVPTTGPSLAARSECKYAFNQEAGNFVVAIYKGGELFNAYTTDRPPCSCQPA